MSACKHCGGLIMEPGKTYGYAGPVCHCIRGYRTDPYPYIEKTPEEVKKQWDKFNKQQLSKGNVKRPSFSHILNLCEQLSLSELRALIGVLNQMHDCESLAADPNGFKK